MLAKTLATILLATGTLVSGQTYSKCDPLKSGNCPPNPALGGTANVDFTQGESKYYEATNAKDAISYKSDGADFTIKKTGDNPTLQSNFYIMFGKVEATLRAAPGTGIVSSFVLQSDDLDEIDLEWLGGDTTQFQSNFFSKGDTTTYDRGQFHGVDAPQQKYHTYTIDWTKDRTVWYLDGQPVRTLESNSPSGYPQTPMNIRVGSWAGGDPTNAPGTIEWAGGATDYSQGPFVLSVKDINVVDYSTGTKYQYTDRSGSWNSIEAVGGKVNGNEGGSNDNSGNVPSSSVQAASSSPAPAPSPSSNTPEPQPSPSTTSQPPASSEKPTETPTPTPTPAPSSSEAASSSAVVESSTSVASTPLTSQASTTPAPTSTSGSDSGAGVGGGDTTTNVATTSSSTNSTQPSGSSNSSQSFATISGTSTEPDQTNNAMSKQLSFTVAVFGFLFAFL